jgi:rare lipoprotein A
VAEAKVYKAIGQGTASYYGTELAGNRTASGERFNPHGLTAAHRTLPLGTKLRVTNVSNGRSVIVRVNDRGPFVGKRLIDVSLGAAQEIQMIRTGTAQVRLEIVPTT